MFVQVVNTLRLILQQILDTLRRSSHSSNVKGCSVAMITEITTQMTGMFKPGILYILSQGVGLDKFYCAWLNIQQNEVAFSRHSKAFSSII